MLTLALGIFADSKPPAVHVSRLEIFYRLRYSNSISACEKRDYGLGGKALHFVHTGSFLLDTDDRHSSPLR